MRIKLFSFDENFQNVYVRKYLISVEKMKNYIFRNLSSVLYEKLFFLLFPTGVFIKSQWIIQNHVTFNQT